MDYTEKQLHSELIFDGHVLHLYKDDILLPDGKVGFREYCKHIGAVCIVPIRARSSASNNIAMPIARSYWRSRQASWMRPMKIPLGLLCASCARKRALCAIN